MGRLVLHIGTHKTATTSIQRFLGRNRAALEARGVWYPDYTLTGQGRHYAHIGMANALSGQSAEFSPDEARTFFRAVRDRVRDHALTILSAEPFYRHLDIPAGAAVPADPQTYWAARRRYVDMLGELFGEARIVVVFRRQADYAQSLYQEQVKVTRYRRGFKTFLRQFRHQFDFLGQVRVWERVFPDPMVLGFERLRAAGDVPTAFATALGIPVEGLDRQRPANRSLPADLVVLKRKLHCTDLGRPEIGARIAALEAALGPDPDPALLRRSFFDGPEKRRDFQSRFEADNAALAAHVPDLMPGETLFPGDPPEDLVYGDELSPPFLDLLSGAARDGLAAAAPAAAPGR